MIRFLADENFNARITRGLRRRVEAIDIVNAQDVGLSHASDSEVLEWAAAEDRVVLSHDVNTLVGIAIERVKLNSPMAGLLIVGAHVEIGAAITDLVLIAEHALDGELRGQIWYLPL